MVDFVYGVSAFERNRGNFPSLPLINMVAERVPTEPGVTLQSRPGLEFSDTVMGSTSVRALFTADGVLNNNLFGVAGTSLYQNETLLGTITGTGPVSFGGYSDYIFINAGDDIHKYNSSSGFGTISFPDSADVLKVLVGASRLIAIRKDSGRIYWSNPLSVTIDPLDFATAENSPDTLRDMLFIGDRLVLFGTETIEFWPVTDDDDLPFAPLVGAVLPVGVKATGSATAFNRTFAWVTNFNEVCISDPDNVISEPDLQIKIANSNSTRLWTFYVDDNEYLTLTITNADGTGETWVYGAGSQTWSQFTSVGATNWLCQCYSNGYFGTTNSSSLARWSNTYTDFDGVFERKFRAWAPLTAESIRVSNIILRTNPGNTPYPTGDYADPTVELRTSRDGGFEWQPWKQRSMGAQGEYRRKVFWNSLGQFSFPGILTEVRNTDPVPFRISGLALNEPFGGR